MVSDGDELPNPSTVVRYANLGQMAKDKDDVVSGPSETAFHGRQGEDYLSVTWTEYFVGTDDQRLRCAIEALRNSNFTVKTKGCFCVGTTDEIIAAGQKHGRHPKAVYHPEPDNKAHAGIYDVAPKDLDAVTDEEALLLDLLVGQAWSRFYTKEMADALPLGECSNSPDVQHDEPHTEV